jgi:CheY-like chemotaxis protein
MSRKRILVVDDQMEMREMARLAFTLAGSCDVLTAASGSEGLELAIAEHPDAILLDVMMPGMDGLATLQHLQRDVLTRSIPVVLLTADERRFTELEIAGVITKPFRPRQLASQVASVLGWSSA